MGLSMVGREKIRLQNRCKRQLNRHGPIRGQWQDGYAKAHQLPSLAYCPAEMEKGREIVPDFPSILSLNVVSSV